jgi:hypothetical protein
MSDMSCDVLSPLLAQSGPFRMSAAWSLAGEKRTSASDYRTIAILGSPQRAPPRGAGSENWRNQLHRLRANESSCENEDRLLGGAWWSGEAERTIAWGSRVGSRAFVGTAKMSEKQDLEREIQRLSEIVGASESALKAKAMSASDRAWLTKQLGLRRIRLSRLGARLEGLRPFRPRRPPR